MKELKGALLIAQSGGPSAVINASAYGAMCAGFESDVITNVYGAQYGITGVLNEKLFILDEEDREELEKLKYTPSSILGSCRYKLAGAEEDDTDYKRILEVFKKYNIRYFCYNGGNDSMDTCNKISDYMKKSDYECRIIGIPKTIDNDLVLTDHCPGYGSVAKYIATCVLEVARDASVYEAGAVTVIECMGRHAGWITAGAALANVAEPCCDYIYLPETDFDIDAFIADVKSKFEEKGNCVIAVSEGIHTADGNFVKSAAIAGTDAFGHTQLGGLAQYLAELIKAKLGYKVRGIELSLLQRSAAHCASLTDIEEAERAGRTAVEAMLDGESDKMVAFECTRDGEYECLCKLVNLEDVANKEKSFPADWINQSGNGVTDDYIRYALPLIEGETKQKTKKGLPDFATLKRHYVKGE